LIAPQTEKTVWYRTQKHASILNGSTTAMPINVSIIEIPL